MIMINRISCTALCLFMFVSCTLKPPQFTVTGIQKKDAVSFLEKFQKEEKTTEQFNHYVESLRARSIPGFAWHDYWSEVEEKKLYNNLTPEELDQLLALSDISCHPKSQDSFARLLLRIAESDSQKLLFSRYLVFLKNNCVGVFSDGVFRSIVWFLSQKRAESESAKLAQAKSRQASPPPPVIPKEGESAKLVQVKSQKPDSRTAEQPDSRTAEQPDSRTAEQPDSRTAGQPDSRTAGQPDSRTVGQPDSRQASSPPVIPAEGGYPYTEELLKLLVAEWSEKRDSRDWPGILSAVDSGLYSDVRYISYEKENWRTVRKALEMEWDTRRSINRLDQDIFWMFEKENKMADIIQAGGYGVYFSGLVGHSSLWEKILLEYPVKPDNGNVDTLLSLYSCEKTALPSYSALVEGWGVPDYSFKNCPDFIKQFKQAKWHKLVRQIRSEGLLQARYGDTITYEPDQLKLLWQAGRMFSLPASVLTTVAKGDSAKGDSGGAFNQPEEQKNNINAFSPVSLSEEESAFIKSATEMLSEKEWEVFILKMMMSLKNPGFEQRYGMFRHIVDKARSVYPLAPMRAVCLMFSLKNSHFLIQEYRLEWVLDMFSLVDWSYFQKEQNGRGGRTTKKNICFNMVSRQKINTLLFVLSYALFNQITPPETDFEEPAVAFSEEYIHQVALQAKNMMSLIQQVRAFDTRTSTLYYDYKKLFGTWPVLWMGGLYGYDFSVEQGLMEDHHLPFWFSSLVFTKLQAVAGTTVKSMQNIVQEYIKERQSEPAGVLDLVHIKWMKYFLDRVDWVSDDFQWNGPKKRNTTLEGNKLTWEKKWEQFENSSLIRYSDGVNKKGIF